MSDEYEKVKTELKKAVIATQKSIKTLKGIALNEKIQPEEAKKVVSFLKKEIDELSKLMSKESNEFDL